MSEVYVVVLAYVCELTNSVSVSYLYRFDLVMSIMNVSCAYCGGVHGECVMFVEIDCTCNGSVGGCDIFVEACLSRYHLISFSTRSQN